MVELLKVNVIRARFAALHKSAFCHLQLDKCTDKDFLARVECAPPQYSLRDLRDRERRARRVLMEEPRLCAGVKQTLPWQASKKLERQALLRDIRNNFYIGDLDSVLVSLKLLGQYQPATYNSGLSFAFLEPVCNEEWLQNLSPLLLSAICTFFLPWANARLLSIKRLEGLVRENVTALTETAILTMVDHFLFQGDLTSARQLLQHCQNGGSPGPALREAWMAYLNGHFDVAIASYRQILAEWRRKTNNPHAYFQSPAGLFFIFALLRNGSGGLIQEGVKAIAGADQIPFFGPVYQTLHTFLREGHAQPAGEESPDDISDFPLNPAQRDGQPQAGDATLDGRQPLLVSVLQFIISAWDSQTTTATQQKWLDKIPAENLADYPWLAREVHNAKVQFWDLEEKSKALPTVTGIVDCMHIRSPWERALSKIAEITSQPAEEKSFRLVWHCEYDNDPNCPVVLHPVEQRVTKNGGWSKGSRFPLLRHHSEHTWPAYLSQQDRLMCSIIIDQGIGQGMKTSSGSGFRCLAALKAAVGHPALFWAGEQPIHFQCQDTAPILHLSHRNDKLHFRLLPAFQPNDSDVIPCRDSQNNLLLYRFSPRHQELADILGEGIDIPQSQADRFLPLIRPLAAECTILSDASLAFTGLPERLGETIPHIRLIPNEKRMSVELFMRPFPQLPRYVAPGEGAKEFLTIEDGGLRRYVRDLEEELRAARLLLAECPVLGEAEQTQDWAWELNGTEQCYAFVLYLQQNAERVRIHWPEGRKIRISKHLTTGNLSLNCKTANDWLYDLDGTVQIDESLVLSFQDILRAAKNQPGNFIQLDDGQIIALADSLRNRLDDLAAVTSDTDDGNLRVTRFAVPFLTELLGDGSPALHAMKEQEEVIRQAQEMEPEVPATLKATLRPYQKEGFTWLYRLDAWGAGACLADDMGLGKTIQAIAIMLAKASEGPCLVVAPTSVCGNWVQELKQFAPSLKVTLFGGTHRRTMLDKMKPGCVLVTSYGLLQSEDGAFQKITWRIAVLDEAQAIKNSHTKRSRAAINLNAQFRLVTTGTPVENNLGELWSIFNFIIPGLLGDGAFFRDRFVSPIEREHDPVAMQRLAAIVKPFILRRSKDKVLTDLPSMTEVTLAVELSPEERAFYQALSKNLRDDLEEKNLVADQQRMQIMAAITKLRLAACNPRLVKSDCNIASSKLATFVELVESLLASQHKILVFSQFVTHLSLVRPVLEERGISYQYLDGQTPTKDRDAAITQFQKGEDKVFLISLRAGGLGLNLTAADYVIILDPWWNPAVEAQASARAHRLGQERPVTIYRLISKDTIETKILNLHQHKKNLADEVLAGTEKVTKLSLEELANLLKD